MITATSKQTEYVELLRDRLKLNPEWFAGYVRATYGAKPANLDIRTCSLLIDELKEWIDHPDKLLRAQGQQDLFGGAL